MDSKYLDIKDLTGVRAADLPGTNLREFTDWAEAQMASGDTSDNILMLASLGLDKQLSKDEVYAYFDSCIKEKDLPLPTGNRILIYTIRRALKEMVYAQKDSDVWSELGRTFLRWYDMPSGTLNSVYYYWSSLHDDFINNGVAGCDYVYFNYARHEKITPDLQCAYIRSTALRFLRLFDNEDVYKM